MLYWERPPIYTVGGFPSKFVVMFDQEDLVMYARAIGGAPLFAAFVLVAMPAIAAEGTWSVVPSPNPPGSSAGLTGSAVLSPTDIWAVGFHRTDPGAEFEPLSMHWDGSAWELVPVPCPAHPLDSWCQLADVSAAGPDDVWAVGSFEHPDEFDMETFVVHWDGSEWSWVPSPTQPDGEGAIFSWVEAMSTGDVWAVGSWPGAPAGGATEPLAARWTGSGWDIHFVPYNTTAGENFEDTSLAILSVVAPDEIWGIGNHDNALLPHVPYVVTWDGSQWDVFEPRPSPDYQAMWGLAAVSSTDVWLAGGRFNPDDIIRPFPVFLHWDGASWTEYESPLRSHFATLTATGPDDVWAATADELAHWNGTSWSIAAVAPGLNQPLVSELEALDGGEIWGVGWDYETTGTTLTLRFEPGATTPVGESAPEARLSMAEARPNPSRRDAAIAFALDRPGRVRLEIWSASGRRVRSLVDGVRTAGDHLVQWDGRDDSGQLVAHGVYFSRLQVDGEAGVRKIVRVR